MATKTLLVLGSGLGGLPIAHHVLKFTSPKVPNLKVVLVSPDTDFYWGLASPRGIISNEFGNKLFTPIAPSFKQYPSDKYELVAGKAETLDPEKNTVVVALNDGGKRAIPYDTLIIATGAAARDNMPWKGLGSTDETRAALTKLQKQIAAAESIVVAGAGTTGVEIAGELGEFSKAGTKQVTLIADKHLPVGPPMKDHIRAAVQSQLEALKVKIIPNSKVTSVTSDGAKGPVTLELTSTDGTKKTLTTDLYIPAFGLVPNTSYVPKNMLDIDGKIKQTTHLRAEGYKNIFVIGDVGNLETARAMNVDHQVHHLTKGLRTYLTTGAEIEEYKPDEKYVLAVSIGKSGGTGEMNGMKIFSLLVWWLKCRYMGTDYYGEIVKGTRTITGKLKG
jgi:apoptosis-inducing factor 2